MTDRTQSGFYNKSSISGRVSLNKLTQARVAITCPGPGSRHPWWWFSFRTAVRLVCLRRTARPITQCDEFTATRAKLTGSNTQIKMCGPLPVSAHLFGGTYSQGLQKNCSGFCFSIEGKVQTGGKAWMLGRLPFVQKHANCMDTQKLKSIGVVVEALSKI